MAHAPGLVGVARRSRGHWPRLLRPHWVPRVPRYQGCQGYQESGSGMGVSGSLPDLPDSTQEMPVSSPGLSVDSSRRIRLGVADHDSICPRRWHAPGRAAAAARHPDAKITGTSLNFTAVSLNLLQNPVNSPRHLPVLVTAGASSSQALGVITLPRGVESLSQSTFLGASIFIERRTRSGTVS